MNIELSGSGALTPVPRKQRAARLRLRLLGAALALVLVACGDPVVPPAGALFNLVSNVSVSAGWLEISHGAGQLISAAPLRSGLLVRYASSGGVTRVAWVGDPQSGSQLQLAFNDNAPGWTVPQITQVVAYRSLDESIGAASFVLQGVESGSSGMPQGSFGPRSIEGIDDQLEAAFADYALGDVDASGQVDVRDALLARRIANGSTTGSTQQRYHADLDGDYEIDSADVALLLEKITDAAAPARLVVKPRSLSFIQLDASTPDEAIVLIGNGGNMPLNSVNRSDPGVSVSETWTIPQQSAVWELGEPADGRWVPNLMSVTGHGGDYSVRLGNLVILIAGQSNASGRGQNVIGWPETSQNDPNVRMLGNDYRWKNAKEPLDSSTGQLDAVSEDTAAAYSFGTRAGNLLYEALGFTTYLIPAALGGSSLNTGAPWWPQGTLDRNTLFGSANFRGQYAAGRQTIASDPNDNPAEAGPVNVIVWYQGESEDTQTEMGNFGSFTNTVMNTFGTQLFGSSSAARVIMAQLASTNSPSFDPTPTLHLRMHEVAELQRQLEITRPNYFLVVTHDLPRSDRIHLSAYGQRVLGERVALAIREHVFGEDIDGTGPRLTGITASGTTVTLRTDRTLQTGSLPTNLFTVFDGQPTQSLIYHATNWPQYFDSAMNIVSAVVPTADPTTVVLTLSSTPTTTPYVRHAPELRLPQGSGSTTSSPEVWEVMSPAVRGAGTGLPLPAFGPLAPF
ncbi:MAG: hypothetical protein KF813_03645 [Trueperaceae bacterium]|nr:hypothetical protein [Trueperaceae bacterium]